MITQKVIQYPIIPYKKLKPNSVDEFLEIFEEVLDLDLENGMELDFLIDTKLGSDKISPTLVLAKLKDAKVIASICKEVYDGTYPYKEIEDERKVKKMIESPDNHFILFEINGEIAGCFRCALDFEHKKGYSGGFMVRKKYQKTLDVTEELRQTILKYSDWKYEKNQLKSKKDRLERKTFLDDFREKIRNYDSSKKMKVPFYSITRVISEKKAKGDTTPIWRQNIDYSIDD